MQFQNMIKDRVEYIEELKVFYTLINLKKKSIFVRKKKKCEHTNSLKYFYYILPVNIMRKT